MTTKPDSQPVEMALYVALQRLLYREAKLLDRRDYKGWLTLFSDDLQYRVRIRSMRDSGAPDADSTIIDEGPVELRKRVEQISTARLSRAENPPSLTRRFVTNVEAFHQDDPSEISLESSILTFRARNGNEEGSFYVGKRHDLIRRLGDDFRIARRDVRLDQAVLFEGTLSTLL
ncbi:MAG: aromatic-ring-hydroxylating dioxygenase subunit beta [Methylovirgula sp.]|uniref:aromatic-ring-hydroxylating dioxygenase subunit beta n=1 Tax=Methylovirgula sp. TaxID=1978224 RepID=UPI0030761249